MSTKGKHWKLSEESKKKHSQICKGAGVGKWMKGRKFSETTRLKMSSARKGHPNYLKKQTEEARRKISNSMQGIKNRLGTKHTAESRKKISEANRGEKSHLWRGGITKINILIRGTIEYRLWRESVFARDGWTCQKCGDNTGGNLQAHHLKSFSKYKELRFAIDNGITLCENCHKTTDSFGRR